MILVKKGSFISSSEQTFKVIFYLGNKKTFTIF